MFLETSNGYLININIISKIYVCYSTNNDPLCSVRAKINNEAEITLYRDKELQFCQEYLENLKEKIAIKMR